MLHWFKPEKFPLRVYQSGAVEAWVKCLKEKAGPSIIVLPTGSGKSLVIANIVNQIDKKTLILQPNKEILEQNYEKFIIYSDSDDVGIFSASVWKKQVMRVVFAMIWSVINCLELFDDFEVIIIDECHLVNAKGWMYEKLISRLGNGAVLWLTATPYRLAQNMNGSTLKFITRTSPKIWKNVIYHSQVADLKEAGYLAQLEYYKVWNFTRSKVRANSTWADFDDNSLKKHFKEIGFDNSVVDVVKRLINVGRRSIIVFTRFTEEAATLARQLGEIAAVITAETKKKDRENLLQRFKAWEIKVIANVWVLTTGFDFPELETIVLARPTKSLALYYQMVGRWLRPHKNKKDCWIVDMCDNMGTFWKVEDLKLVNWLDKAGRPWMRFIESNWKPLTNVTMERYK